MRYITEHKSVSPCTRHARNETPKKFVQCYWCL